MIKKDDLFPDSQIIDKYETDVGNKIYVFDNGKKYKQYNKNYSSLRNIDNMEFLKTLQAQAKEKSSLITFPEQVVCTDNKLYGITSDFAYGTPLDEIFLGEDIGHLIESIDKLEQEIIRISNNGWYISNLTGDDIIINYLQSPEETLKIVNTDFIEKREDVLKNISNNLRYLFNIFIYKMLPNIRYLKLNDNPEFREKFALASEGKMPCSEFITYLMNLLGLNLESYTSLNALRHKVK